MSDILLHRRLTAVCACADQGLRTRQKEAVSNVIMDRIRRRLRHNALRSHIVLQVRPPWTRPAAGGSIRP